MAIVKGAGLIMKAIIEVRLAGPAACLSFSICHCDSVCVICQEGDKEIATKMQDLALSEGALPRHLHTSMFTISADQRMLTNRSCSLTVHYRRLHPSYTGNH